MLSKVNSSITNPLTINSLIGAAVGNLTIDDTLTKGDLLHIADVFRGLPASNLVTETLPTVAYTSSGGAAALKEAQPYAQNVINQFNAIGSTPRRRPRRRHPPGGQGHHHDHDDDAEGGPPAWSASTS